MAARKGSTKATCYVRHQDGSENCHSGWSLQHVQAQSFREQPQHAQGKVTDAAPCEKAYRRHRWGGPQQSAQSTAQRTRPETRRSTKRSMTWCEINARLNRRQATGKEGQLPYHGTGTASAQHAAWPCLHRSRARVNHERHVQPTCERQVAPPAVLTRTSPGSGASPEGRLSKGKETSTPRRPTRPGPTPPPTRWVSPCTSGAHTAITRTHTQTLAKLVQETPGTNA